MRNEVKIKSALLNISSALAKSDFQTTSKIQSEIADKMINNKEYCNDFFNVYAETKKHVNKQFLNIMEEIIVKSNLHSREELGNKFR